MVAAVEHGGEAVGVELGVRGCQGRIQRWPSLIGEGGLGERGVETVQLDSMDAASAMVGQPSGRCPNREAIRDEVRQCSGQWSRSPDRHLGWSFDKHLYNKLITKKHDDIL
jgi:hypothetical protein